MVKATSNRKGLIKQTPVMDREEKILNIMSNTSILLMALMTEAFSGLFANMAEGMVNAFTSGFDASGETTKEGIVKIQDLKQQIPKQVVEQMVSMKADINKQLQAKKQEIRSLIAAPAFDEGIRIAEQYDVGLQKMTQDLDELSLLRYIALLKANDPVCTKMFQELVEWMKTIPQPNGTDRKEK